MCLCIPTDCKLYTDPDCTSRYIINGSLGCDDNCNGCRANECQQAVCGSVRYSPYFFFRLVVSIALLFLAFLILYIHAVILYVIIVGLLVSALSHVRAWRDLDINLLMYLKSEW